MTPRHLTQGGDRASPRCCVNGKQLNELRNDFKEDVARCQETPDGKRPMFACLGPLYTLSP
jgi:hypothetical protein